MRNSARQTVPVTDDNPGRVAVATVVVCVADFCYYYYWYRVGRQSDSSPQESPAMMAHGQIYIWVAITHRIWRLA